MISRPARNSMYYAVPLLLFCLLTVCSAVCAQAPPATSEIPIPIAIGMLMARCCQSETLSPSHCAA